MNEHLTHLLNYTYLNYLFFPLRFQHGRAVIYIFADEDDTLAMTRQNCEMYLGPYYLLEQSHL